MRLNAEQASKALMWEPPCMFIRHGLAPASRARAAFGRSGLAAFRIFLDQGQGDLGAL